MEETILLVEDEVPIGTLVREYLGRHGFGVVWVRSGEQALAELPRHSIRLVILDLGLPGMDGIEVCRRIDRRVPVVMLTARDEEADRVAGLELGADDYVAKPFSPRELVARIRAVLRRADGGPGSDEALMLGPVAIMPARREVQVDGLEVELTRREFELLSYLAERAGAVVSRADLLEHVWGFELPGDTRTIEVHVAQLRKKLGHPELIKTVRGVGYRVAG